MVYDERLAARVRRVLGDVPGVSERKMFGGVCFLINGNMACGPVRDFLMIRVGPEEYEQVLAEGPARPMTFTGRPMRGIVEVEAAALNDDDVLDEWVQRGIDFASSLPPKRKA
jgi:TfoX/Sxy family transcriptional regulator of competence genes